MFVWHFDEFVKLLIKFKHSVHNLPPTPPKKKKQNGVQQALVRLALGLWQLSIMFAVNNSLSC